MRRSGVMLVLVVASAAVWATSATAVGSPQTFSLLEVSSNDAAPINGFTFDRAPVGGDQFAFASKLYKWAGVKRGALAGRDEGIATFITGFGPDFSQNATALFVAQAYLQSGTILIQGFGRLNADGPSRFTFPIVGGTGIYANARGYLKVRDIGNGTGNKTNLEFHVMP